MIGMIMGFANWILAPLMEIFDLPVVPQSFFDLIQAMLGYMRTGMSIINIFCPVSFIAVCVNIFITVYMVEHAYFVVLWVLKKIPLFGIE